MESKLILVFLFFALLSCKKEAAVTEISAEEAVQAIKLPSASKGEPAKVGVLQIEQKNIEQKIIRNGNFKFETNDLEATYEQIKKAVKKNSAIIQNDSEGKDYNSIYRRITVRIPNENFDSFVKDISAGVDYFDTKDSNAQDVTQEYIDIEARLKAKKKLENRYIELLAKATKITEMLAIEAQLSAIREEIESKEGQLKYLQNQVSLSTVTLEFYKTIAEESGVRISYGAKVWNAIQSGFYAISNFVLGLLEVWPFILIASVIFHFVRKRINKRKLRKNI